jgi:hypothetical protein
MVQVPGHAEAKSCSLKTKILYAIQPECLLWGCPTCELVVVMAGWHQFLLEHYTALQHWMHVREI